MSIPQLRKRVSKLQLNREDDAITQHWLRRAEERQSLLVYFISATPESLQEQVWATIEPYLDPLVMPWLRLPEEAPLICKWVEVLDLPGGRIPNPMPEALVQLFLDHPIAEVLWWDCEQCGVFVPEVKRQPVVKRCPVCSGPIGWQAFQKKHGYYLPSLTKGLPSVEQLLKGKR